MKNNSLAFIIILLTWNLAPSGPASGRLARLNAALRDDGPNARDYDRIERGYYERLIDPDRRPDGPARVPHAPFDAGVLARSVDDVREYVLKPGLATTHKGATWTTNALGMRDKDYTLAKPPGTIRVGLVGDSIASGWGVDDGLGFEPSLERIWNERIREGRGSDKHQPMSTPHPNPPPQGGRESECSVPQNEVFNQSPPPLRGRVRVGGGRANDREPIPLPPRVEVLNFAVPGHAPGQRWEHFARVGWATGPDLVIFEGTAADLGWDERRLRALIPRGLGLDAPAYRDALAEAGVDASGDLKSRLRPHREAILLGVYRRVVADCRDRGVPAVWLLLPRVGKPADPRDRAKLVGLAKAAGFDRMVDLSDAFDGLAASSLAIAPDDFHPNAAGHAELARRIDAALAELLSSSAPSGRPLQ